LDKAMEAMMTGLCEIAEEVLCKPPSSQEEGEVCEQSPAQCCWPQMSDEVWRRIAQKSEGDEVQWRVPVRECLQRWASRGFKRQRITDDSQVDEHRALPTRTGTITAQVALRPEPALRSALATSARPVSTAVAPQKSVAREQPPSFGPSARLRSALAARSKTAPAILPGRTSLIKADELQSQRGRLKKVQTREACDKENASPAPGAPGSNSASDNVGVKRLKERCVMPDDHDECTEHTVTAWILPPPRA